jgi:hypothetical protein
MLAHPSSIHPSATLRWTPLSTNPSPLIPICPSTRTALPHRTTPTAFFPTNPFPTRLNQSRATPSKSLPSHPTELKAAPLRADLRANLPDRTRGKGRRPRRTSRRRRESSRRRPETVREVREGLTRSDLRFRSPQIRNVASATGRTKGIGSSALLSFLFPFSSSEAAAGHDKLLSASPQHLSDMIDPSSLRVLFRTHTGMASQRR